MKVFGLGTVATLSNVACYTRFTTKMLHVYTAMEEELERATPATAKASHSFWQARSTTPAPLLPSPPPSLPPPLPPFHKTQCE